MASEQDTIERRKLEHIDLCVDEAVEYRSKTTLLEDVHLLHDALPELCLDEISLSTQLVGKRLEVPLLITGMTGGVSRAGEINRALAEVAATRGVAFGVGSQRAMLRDSAATRTYQVRDVAPDLVILGNIGVVQASQMSSQELQDLAGNIDADVLAIHLNPAQELIQPEGDRDFRGGLDTIQRVQSELSIPILVKETGCGLSPRTLSRIRATGVQWVDVSGAGGTTWVGVETLRTTEERVAMGNALWEWGVPTGVSVAAASQAGLRVVGSGGIRNGLDVAKVVALGA
ncbi:MAG: type 2 isopentenyl-diphosphate Delta-isomerase, partial [Myxococcales bacterium]|nr:type 2 isopentenyl-diphosphate Delta-isomerase [Myxococcales bacterium]